MNYLVMFACGACLVFLKVIQTRNVTYNNDWAIMPTAILMGFAEVGVYLTVIRQPDWWLALPYGVSGGIAALCGMRFSRWALERKKAKDGETEETVR